MLTEKEKAYMIFCVEDDSSIRDLMLYTLNSAGFEAKRVFRWQKLFDVLQAEKPQLIMLDIMLPGEDGIAILKKTAHTARNKRDTCYNGNGQRNRI